MYTRPLAYFLTWHTYGTWLHGREDGSVDRRQNQHGAPSIKPRPLREQRARQRMSSEPMVFSKAARSVVDGVIREHCAMRTWHLIALNVRSNHVHLVVSVGDVEPERVVAELKQWGTRRLRERELVADEQPVWAKHASTRHLFDDLSVQKAARYTAEGQDRR